MPIPDLRTRLKPFRTGAAGAGRGRARRWRPAPGDAPGASRLRRRTRGSALVAALIAGLIALIGALVLASRLFSSRFNTFSRNDTLAAREAAEFGLNELQAQLNTNQFAYLWVTRRNRWNSVDIDALNDCQVAVQDDAGAPATSLATLPAGFTGTRTIRTDAATGTSISYRLTDFEPPRLPDTETATTDQARYCANSTSAANFGNLSGGSALITVEGTVTRGGRSSNFRLTRRTHVAMSGGGEDLAFSFMILGDAYDDKANKEKFGDKDDIANLNYLDGNICYGNITDSTCFTTPPLPKTIIGCYDLGSCLINNVNNNELKDKLSKYCSDVKAKQKKKSGFTCNEFQQAAELPPALTPLSEGFLNDSGAPYTNVDWVGTTEGKGKNSKVVGRKSVEIECDLKDKKCKSNISSNFYVAFPYRSDNNNLPPSSLSSLENMKNSELVDGCYFNNVNSLPDTKYDKDKTTAINCLFSRLTIKDESKDIPNLMVYTTTGSDPFDPAAAKLLPVNIFLYGDPSDSKYNKIELKEGDIDNSDRSDLGWSRLRILGKQVSTTSGSSVSCSESPAIVSKKANDLNNLWLWLPNAALIYDKKSTKDNAYLVVWACKFEGPTKEKDKDPYSIITPIPEQLVRAGIVSRLGSGFIQSAAEGIYRGYGYEDSPAS